MFSFQIINRAGETLLFAPTLALSKQSFNIRWALISTTIKIRNNMLNFYERISLNLNRAASIFIFNSVSFSNRTNA